MEDKKGVVLKRNRGDDLSTRVERLEALRHFFVEEIAEGEDGGSWTLFDLAVLETLATLTHRFSDDTPSTVASLFAKLFTAVEEFAVENDREPEGLFLDLLIEAHGGDSKNRAVRELATRELTDDPVGDKVTTSWVADQGNVDRSTVSRWGQERRITRVGSTARGEILWDRRSVEEWLETWSNETRSGRPSEGDEWR